MNPHELNSLHHSLFPQPGRLRRGAMAVIWLLMLTALFASCSRQGGRREAAHGQRRPDVARDYTAEAWRAADSAMAAMSRREKVGQLFMPAVYARADRATMERVGRYIGECHVGGIVLLRGDIPGARAIADTLAASCPAGAWVAVDAETGLAMRLEGTPSIPPAATLGREADGQGMYDLGHELARQCRALGINMVLGPVLDVETLPDGYIGRRSYGSDPVKVAELGVAFARGLEDGGVASVAKHFPGHGGVAADTHRRLGVIHRSLAQIEQTALVPFREYCEAGLSGIMAGHLAVPAIDPELRSASLSRPVLTDLLRGDLAFRGLVLTDALNMKGAVGADDGTDSSVAAIAAGADIVIAPADTEEAIEAVEKAIETGELDESDVDEHVRRVLFFKYRFARRQSRDSSE